MCSKPVEKHSTPCVTALKTNEARRRAKMAAAERAQSSADFCSSKGTFFFFVSAVTSPLAWFLRNMYLGSGRNRRDLNVKMRKQLTKFHYSWNAVTCRIRR